MNKLIKLVNLLRYPGAIKAFLFWPKFSLASYSIVRRLLLAGVKPITVVDLGANVGQFAVAAAELLNPYKIISIEPDPIVAEYLKKNIVKYKNLDIHISAIGNFDGEVDFYSNIDSQVSSLFQIGADRIRAFPDSKVSQRIRVAITTLDSLFANNELKEPILLKIDVQGAEGLVLDGATEFLRKVKWIVLETTFSELYKGEPSFDQIYQKLKASGFSFSKALNFHLAPDNDEIIEMDALFTRSKYE